VLLASQSSVTTAAAAPQRTVTQKADARATDFSARRYYHRYYRHYGSGSYAGFYYRPYPSYYGRPDYYQPYPYYAPYAYGFRYGPLVW
jgi:hypothetical protein